jgi:hypothetical protein
MELREKNKRDSERDRNREQIYQYVNEYIEQYDKQPTYKTIGQKLNLNIKTVMNHMKALTNTKALPNRVLKFSMHFDAITKSLIKKAKTGDVHACRLYYSLVWGFNEKNTSELASQITERPIINITTTSPLDEGINISNN